MYAVIAFLDGKTLWLGPYESKEEAETVAAQHSGSRVVLYHPFDTGDIPEDNYGREVH